MSKKSRRTNRANRHNVVEFDFSDTIEQLTTLQVKPTPEDTVLAIEEAWTSWPENKARPVPVLLNNNNPESWTKPLTATGEAESAGINTARSTEGFVEALVFITDDECARWERHLHSRSFNGLRFTGVENPGRSRSRVTGEVTGNQYALFARTDAAVAIDEVVRPLLHRMPMWTVVAEAELLRTIPRVYRYALRCRPFLVRANDDLPAGVHLVFDLAGAVLHVVQTLRVTDHNKCDEVTEYWLLDYLTPEDFLADFEGAA